jgi:hypothetical protein
MGSSAEALTSKYLDERSTDREVGGTGYSNYRNGMWVPVEAVIG